MNWKRMKVIAAVPVALAVTAGAVQLGISYRNGNGFHPFGTEREMKNNQILFPDSQESTGKQTDQAGEDDSSFLEKDNNKEDKAQQGNSSDYLFDGEDSSNPENRPAGALVQGDGAANGTADSANGGPIGADGVYEVTDDTNGADVILPGGNTGNGGVTIPGGQGGSGSGGSGSGSGNGSGSGANAGGNGGGTAGGTTGGGTAPSPAPTPGALVPTLGDPIAEDPGENKKYPPDMLGDSKIFDEDQLPSGIEDKNVTIIKRYSAEALDLYCGQTINQNIIFCALDTFVVTSDLSVYYWDENALGVYFAVDAVSFDNEVWYDISDGSTLTIPEAAETMYIKVRYRMNKEGPWRDREVSYALEKNRILVLKTKLGKDGKVSSDMLLNTGKYDQSQKLGAALNLLRWLSPMLGNQESSMAETQSARTTAIRLSKLFPGWTENGKSVDWYYPVTYGRHVLEPADLVKLDTDTYQVELKDYWLGEDYSVESSGQLSYLQTLAYYKGADRSYDASTGSYYIERLEVPEYVQAVDFPYSAEETDTLVLPDSVLYVNTTGLQYSIDFSGNGLGVRKGYVVAEGNPRYTSENGLLYNLDKTELLGVPTDLTELTVGKNITKVVLPYWNHVKRLVLEADSVDALPEINYETLRKDCKIVVSAELLDNYLRTERTTLRSTGLYVCAAERPEASYYVKDEAAITNGGSMHLMLNDTYRWLSLPEYVNGLEADSLRDLSQLTMLFLPQDGHEISFEAGCFNGAASLENIACYSQKQYEAALAAVRAAGLKINVQLVNTQTVNGYTYQVIGDNVMLTKAPENITEFNGVIEGEDESGKQVRFTVTAISDGAFEDCEQLIWVDLPEETKSIGYQAFKGCLNLEGVLIGAEDTVMIGQEAFNGCSSLRFVASNAAECDLKDTEFALDGELYCPTYSKGYNGNWISFDAESNVKHYEMVNCGGTRVLYGVTDDTPWLALRSGGKVTDAVKLPTDTLEIFSEAFRGVQAADDQLLKLNWQELTKLVWIDGYAFADSALGDHVVLPENLTVATQAFAGCNRLVEVTLPSEYRYNSSGISIAEMAFSNCEMLEKVILGDTNYYGGIGNYAFYGCSALENITFIGGIPKLELHSMGYPFKFNGAWDDSEVNHLTLTVEESQKADFVKELRYLFAGYCDGTDYNGNYLTAYQWLFNDIAYYNPGASSMEQLQMADDKILETENELRTMLGMEELNDLQRPFTYVVDKDGNLILTDVEVDEWGSVDLGEMELPYGWYLDYIGKGAFANSPHLRTLYLPKAFGGFLDGAVEGLTFDENNDDDRLYVFIPGEIPELIINENGQPFNFGIPDKRIGLLSWSIDFDNVIRAWLLPMAGYTDLASMQRAFTDAEGNFDLAGYEAALVAAENRVRVLLGGEDAGYPLIDSADDMIGLTEPTTPEEPEWPYFPDGIEDYFDLPETPETPAPSEDAEEANGDTGDEAEDTEEPNEAADEADENTEEEQETGEATGTEEETAE